MHDAHPFRSDSDRWLVVNALHMAARKFKANLQVLQEAGFAQNDPLHLQFRNQIADAERIAEALANGDADDDDDDGED